MYNSMGSAATRMFQREGLRSMWRGVNSVILGAGMSCVFSKYVALFSNSNLHPHYRPCPCSLFCYVRRSQGASWSHIINRTLYSGNRYVLSSPYHIPTHVSYSRLIKYEKATAGALATMASDALMNPFDGTGASLK